MIYLFISMYLNSLILLDAMKELYLALFNFFKLKMCVEYASHGISSVEFKNLTSSHEVCGCLTICILLMIQV